MRPKLYLPLLALTAAFAAPLAHAQSPVPQVEAWPLQKTAALGSAIYLQDRAAARATDALLASSNGTPPQGLIGWIVIPRSEGHLVRFLTGDTSNPTARFDIPVDANGRAGSVTAATDTILPPEQLAQYNARLAAATSLTASDLRCAARYNAVMLDDPDSDGWLVWLLASTTEANIVPMGGHYRFHISADGKSVLKREQLSASCLNMDKTGQSVGLLTSILVAPRPLEVHVFLSLYARTPIFAIAGDKVWAVQGARITDTGPAPARR